MTGNADLKHVETQTELSFEHVECQTDITIDDMYKTEQSIDNTIIEITDLKKNVLDSELSQKCFQNDNEKTKFYTGLPSFSILMGVFGLISGQITSNLVPRLFYLRPALWQRPWLELVT